MVRKSKMAYVPYILASCWNDKKTNTELEELFDLSSSDLSRILHEMRYKGFLSNVIMEDGRIKPNLTNKEKIYQQLIHDIQFEDFEINRIKQDIDGFIPDSIHILSLFNPKFKMIVTEEQFSHSTIQLLLTLSNEDIYENIMQIENDLNEQDLSERDKIQLLDNFLAFQLKIIMIQTINPKIVEIFFKKHISNNNTSVDELLFKISLRISACIYYYSMLSGLGSPLDLDIGQ